MLFRSLCVQEYIGQESHNNRLLWLELSKCETSLAVSLFEVEVVVSRLASAQQISKWYFYRKNCYLHQVRQLLNH